MLYTAEFGVEQVSPAGNAWLFAEFTGFGQVGVMLFLLISSYFLCTKNFNVLSFGRILLQTLFYMVCLYVVSGLLSELVFDQRFFSLPGFANVFLILTNDNYWFIQVYLVFYLIYPFFNLILQKINQKQHLYFIVVALMVFFVISPLGGVVYAGTNYNTIIFNLFMLVIVYFVGAYIRLYGHQNLLNKKWVAVVGMVVCLGIHIIVHALMAYKPTAQMDGTLWNFRLRNNLNMFMLAVFIFLLFKNLHIKHNRVINLISSATFGVYIIHKDKYLRHLYMGTIFQLPKYVASYWLVPWCVVTVAVVYTVATLVDLLRKCCLERPLFRWLQQKFPDQIQKINAFYPTAEVNVNPETQSAVGNRTFWFYVFFGILNTSLFAIAGALCGLSMEFACVAVFAAVIVGHWMVLRIRARKAENVGGGGCVNDYAWFDWAGKFAHQAADDKSLNFFGVTN